MGFYDRLKQARGDDAALEGCIRNTVAKLRRQATDCQRPGMLLGKIQAGKTRAFLGVIALAFDEGYDVAIVLTKGTKTLARQTVSRVSGDFAVFQKEDTIDIYDIMAVPALTEWEVEEHKLIFVVKKQYRNMERLMKLFCETQPLLQHKKVLIIDDEADFASIRFTKRRGEDEIEQGRIAEQVDELRRTLRDSSFLQVTATPYSLYLQPEEYEPSTGAGFSFEPKRPAFTELLPIHAAYVGGDEYFGQHDETEPEFYLWHPVEDAELHALKKEDRRRIRTEEILKTPKVTALRHALVTFVTGAAIRRLQQKANGEPLRKYSLVVHVETARAAHSWQHTVVGEIIDALKEASLSKSLAFAASVHEALIDLTKSVVAAGLPMPAYEPLLAEVSRAFERGGVVTEKVNSDNDVMALLDENAELKLRTPYNVFIGGQIIDRGITVPNLIGFYYGRSPKRMQQDTVLQHSRMYGARPRADLAVTRFYTTASNHEALRSIHEFDSALRYAFETGAQDRGVAFVLKDEANRVIPCAPNKILVSEVHALRPGGRWLPVGFQSRAKTHIELTVGAIDQLIPKDSKDTRTPVKVSLELALQIIEHIESTLEFKESGYGFDWNAFKAAIEYYSRIVAPAVDAGYCFVLAATDRSVTRIREEGRFLDAPDTKQQREDAAVAGVQLPVLVLLRQNGEREKGWGGYPFWWPVLFAPKNSRPSVFATTVREDEPAPKEEPAGEVAENAL